MKNRFFKILLILVFAFVISTDYCLAQKTTCDATDGRYHLLESIPGVAEGCEVVEFPEYMSGIYKFSFVAIAVSALLMITIGGFYWLMSAGNQSQAGTAKKLITDALIGLAVALVSWLILNTINPDLLKGELDTGAMKVDNENWTDEDQKKFDEGLEAAERLDETNYDEIHEKIDEIEKAEEERQNRPDIFQKPDVDPDRETDGLTDEERQKIIDDWYKENYGDK